VSKPGSSGPADDGDARQQIRSVVVVGAGLAGARTVAALRAHGFDGHLTVLGNEGLPPYDRPPLSKSLFDRIEPAWLTEELGLDLRALADDVRLGEPATGLSLDATGVQIHLSGPAAATLRADAVVLACGSHALRPAGWDAALTLHTSADAARLRGVLVPGARLVVVGAGWIGAEVAGVAAARGVEVTVVEAGATPLARQLGEHAGALTAPWYGAAGIVLLTGALVDAVDAGGVRLADGRRLPADVVLASIGAVPSTGWLRGSVPLTARGAVPVDSTGLLDCSRVPAAARPDAATAARVWAVGDCADRSTDRFGEVPGGHWSGALAHPEAIACAMTRVDPPAETAPYVFSDQLGHRLTLTGSPADDAEIVHRGVPGGSEGWTTLWFAPAARLRADEDAVRGRELLAVLTVDRARDVGPARRILSRPQRARLDVARAADPTVPLQAAVLS
jgi:3-phenylpropionate/trans-cinnamate dioxygenase ferredoxin reductase subunit